MKDWEKEGTELIKGFNERLMKRKRAETFYKQTFEDREREESSERHL